MFVLILPSSCDLVTCCAEKAWRLERERDRDHAFCERLYEGEKLWNFLSVQSLDFTDGKPLS